MDYLTIQPFIQAAGIGFAYAWAKYRSNILDPTKPTPEKFEWPKAISTTILAVIICIVFTAAGNALDVTELDMYMGLFAGLATGSIEPVVKAIFR